LIAASLDALHCQLSSKPENQGLPLPQKLFLMGLPKLQFQNYQRLIN
jgi:hypothetical protein